MLREARNEGKENFNDGAAEQTQFKIPAPDPDTVATVDMPLAFLFFKSRVFRVAAISEARVHVSVQNRFDRFQKEPLKVGDVRTTGNRGDPEGNMRLFGDYQVHVPTEASFLAA